MCKYCDCKNYTQSLETRYGEPLGLDGANDCIVIETNGSEYAISSDSFEISIDFCPKCGLALGEVKPLTVEQLRRMDGKPVFVVSDETGERVWTIISINENGFVAKVTERGRFYYFESDYGICWTAFDREPIGITLNKESDYSLDSHYLVDEIKRITEYQKREPKGEAE